MKEAIKAILLGYLLIITFLVDILIYRPITGNWLVDRVFNYGAKYLKDEPNSI